MADPVIFGFQLVSGRTTQGSVRFSSDERERQLVKSLSELGRGLAGTPNGFVALLRSGGAVDLVAIRQIERIWIVDTSIPAAPTNEDDDDSSEERSFFNR